MDARGAQHPARFLPVRYMRQLGPILYLLKALNVILNRVFAGGQAGLTVYLPTLRTLF